jgi:hypothetical protein
MACHHLLPITGGHAVVMTGCDPHSLTFLNSWGGRWGDCGSFRITDTTVLEVNSSYPVEFYDVGWFKEDLVPREITAFRNEWDNKIRNKITNYSSLLTLEAQCPICTKNVPIVRLTGDFRQAECPFCHKSFSPEPAHVLQALYAK